MFAGIINHQTVISDRPVLVVDGEDVLNSFSEMREAARFIEDVGSDTALIFRHNGSNWDVCLNQKRGSHGK